MQLPRIDVNRVISQQVNQAFLVVIRGISWEAPECAQPPTKVDLQLRHSVEMGLQHPQVETEVMGHQDMRIQDGGQRSGYLFERRSSQQHGIFKPIRFFGFWRHRFAGIQQGLPFPRHPSLGIQTEHGNFHDPRRAVNAGGLHIHHREALGARRQQRLQWQGHRDSGRTIVLVDLISLGAGG